MNYATILEVAEAMQEIASREPGLIDWESMVSELYLRGFLMDEKKKSILHHAKRIAQLWEKLKKEMDEEIVEIINYGEEDK